MRHKLTIVMLVPVAMILALNDASNAESFIIQPTDVVASSSWENRIPVRCIDGSGFSPSDASLLITGNSVPEEWPQHSLTHATFWLSIGGDVTPTITFDLGDVYQISGFHLWNYNEQPPNNLRGIRAAEVRVSSTGTSIADATGYSMVDFTPQEIASAAGLAPISGDTYLFAEVVTGRFVEINTITNWGNSSHTGISEIRFIAVPEPATMLLLGLGGLLIRRKKGNRQAG